jgi:hypothetical protein
MNKLVGILAVLSVISVPAFPQPVGGGVKPVAVKNRVTYLHMVLQRRGARDTPRQKTVIIATRKGIPTLRTSIPTARGLGMTPAAMTRTTISITRGSTGAFRAASDEAMFGGWQEEAPVASGSRGSTSAWPIMMSASAKTGCGIVIRS